MEKPPRYSIVIELFGKNLDVKMSGHGLADVKFIEVSESKKKLLPLFCYFLVNS